MLRLLRHVCWVSLVLILTSCSGEFTDLPRSEVRAAALTSLNTDDFNGDGMTDLVMGDYPANATSASRGSVYYGNSEKALVPNQLVLPDTESTYHRNTFARNLTRIGDVNGDGFSDLASVSFDTYASETKLHVLYGSKTGVDMDARQVFTFKETALPGLINFLRNAGTFLSAAGDFNCDGFSDFVMGHASGDKVTIFYGGTEGIQRYQGRTVRPFDVEPTYRHRNLGFGWVVSSAGDFDGDGCWDIAVGAPPVGCHSNSQNFSCKLSHYMENPGAGEEQDQEAIYVIYGNKNQDAPIDSHKIKYNGVYDAPMACNSDGVYALDESRDPSPTAVGFGISIAGNGDIDGDGYDDLVVGAPYTGLDFAFDVAGGRSNDRGVAYVIWGRAERHLYHSRIFIRDPSLSEFRHLLGGADVACVPSDAAESGYIHMISDQNFFNTAPLFGYHVTMLGDINGDGLADFAASAPRSRLDDQVISGRVYVRNPTEGHRAWGGVYVFEGDRYSYRYNFNKLPDRAIKYKDFSEEANHDFGRRMSAVGDWDQDEHPDWVIGAPRADGTKGGVFFVNSNGSPTPLKESGPSPAIIATPGDSSPGPSPSTSFLGLGIN